MIDKYEAGIDSDGNLRVDGPGNGFGYYASKLWPDLACENEKEMKKAVKMCNIAYKEGYAQAQRDICKALGVKT